MPKTSGKGNTTPELRALICRKYEEGISSSDIAAFFDTTICTVQRVIKNYQERGHHNDAARSGRPPRLNDRSIRHLKYVVEGNRRQTLSDITLSVNGALSIPAHPRTIRHTLDKHLDMHSRVAAKKPFLKDSHKRERLAWARTHKGWDMELWKKIIWTDESSVEIGKQSRQVMVWRRPGERYSQNCLSPTFKSGRQSLMVWGCIAHGRLGPLIRMPKGRQKGVDYIDVVLDGPLLDFYMELSEERGLVAVREDGAPVHRCKLAQEYRTERQMVVFPHPAQSPDLNPIEHVWKYLKVMVNQRPTRPQNLDALWNALLEEWEKIDVGFINSLIESMPDRAQAVMDALGGSTKY
jgi:transposase